MQPPSLFPSPPPFSNYHNSLVHRSFSSTSRHPVEHLLKMDPSSPSEGSSRNSPAIPPSSTLSHRPSTSRQGQSGSASPNINDGPIPDDEHGADLQMNMTASIMLTGLPRDAHQALADVEAIDAGKGTIGPTSNNQTAHSPTQRFAYFESICSSSLMC